MINYHIHENGWTVILDDVDLKTITQEDVNQIAKLVASHTCLVIKNQSLSIADQLRVIKMFKNPEPLFTPNDEDFIHCAADLTQDPTGIICRVTGELNEHGKEGIAGFVDEMTWHCNHPYRENRRPLVWLYGVRGTKGSRTSWNNNILSYQDLDSDKKELLSNLKIVTKEGLENAETHGDGNTGRPVYRYTPSVVHTNNAGKTGLFFPFLQIHQFVGMTPEESQEIINPLAEFTTQEKYCYHHDWEDGDIVISEQWLGIHKRWRFEKISTRLLHRAVFDFPDQEYI